MKTLNPEKQVGKKSPKSPEGLPPFEIIASNAIGWGKGKTLPEASANCHKETRRVPTKFYMVPAGTELDGLTARYPQGATFTMTEL